MINNYKNPNRKDEFGNLLLSDEAFEIGYNGGKEYFDRELKYHNLKSLKHSNVFLSYLEQEIFHAIDDKDMNPDFDITYQDLTEIIGCITGELVNLKEYSINALKGWTGKKYNGYIPEKIKQKISLKEDK